MDSRVRGNDGSAGLPRSTSLRCLFAFLRVHRVFVVNLLIILEKRKTKRPGFPGRSLFVDGA
jgi:hypothetical protein